MQLSTLLRTALGLGFAGLALAGFAQDRKATPEEAVAMVKRAVAAVQNNGPRKAYADITDRRGSFVERDLYVTVWSLGGEVRAHGANANMVGKNLIDLRDIDGKPFIRERLALARTQPTFWHDYQYTHPETRKIEPKRMYCEALEDSVVCAGVYR